MSKFAPGCFPITVRDAANIRPVVCVNRPWIKRTERRGIELRPCGAPEFSGRVEDVLLSNLTVWVRK